MPHCYKCGCPLSSGSECDPPCAGRDESEVILTSEQIQETMEHYEANSVPIDWDAVKTFEDLKEVTKVLVMTDSVLRGSWAYHKLRKFLKEKNLHD